MRSTLVVLAIVAFLAVAIGLPVVFYTGAVNEGCHLYALSIGQRFPEGFIEPDWQSASTIEGVSVRDRNLETDLQGHRVILQKIQGGYGVALDQGREMAAVEAEDGGIVDVAVICQKILFPGNRQESILAKYVEGQWWIFRP